MAWPPVPRRRSDRVKLGARVLAAVAVVLALAALLMPPDPPDCENPYGDCSLFGAGEQRARERQLERIGGGAMVLAVRFEYWVAPWFKGRRLVALLALSSLACAGACAKVARLLRVEEDDEDDRAARRDPATRPRNRP